MHHLNKYKVKVNPAIVREEAKRILVQFSVPDNTSTVLAHASIDGFELAVATSPCVDARNFSEELGRKYSMEKVMELATNKLWEIEGVALHWLLKNRTESEDDFRERYGDKFIFELIEDKDENE